MTDESLNRAGLHSTCLLTKDVNRSWDLEKPWFVDEQAPDLAADGDQAAGDGVVFHLKPNLLLSLGLATNRTAPILTRRI